MVTNFVLQQWVFQSTLDKSEFDYRHCLLIVLVSDLVCSSISCGRICDYTKNVLGRYMWVCLEMFFLQPSHMAVALTTSIKWHNHNHGCT